MTRAASWYLLSLAALLLAPAAVAAPNPHGSLGASCSETADCDDPELECVAVDSKRMAGAGPAGGICTRECTTDADCDAWDTAAGCFRHDDASAAFCFESCQQNNYETTELPADRCHGRDDIACTGSELGFTTPLCWPLCTSDAQCDGQSCNKHVVGLCQEERLTGDSFGTECDHTVTPTTCEGYCSWYANQMGQCSEPCVIGAPGACGAVEGEAGEAACLGSLSGGGTGIGDLGSCLELCSCNADCSTPGWVCRTTGLAGPFGARGTCYPQEYVPDSILECFEAPEDLGACVYGEVRACKGEDDCLGTARCNDDRTAYLDCECLTEPAQGGDAGAGSGVGAAGATGSGGEPSSSDGGEPAAGAPPAPNPHGATPKPGCDCRHAGGTSGGSAVVVALLFGAALASRRRLGR